MNEKKLAIFQVEKDILVPAYIEGYDEATDTYSLLVFYPSNAPTGYFNSMFNHLDGIGHGNGVGEFTRLYDTSEEYEEGDEGDEDETLD